MTTFDEFYKSLVATYPDNKARGTHFEKICKWFLQTDPRYVGRLEKVWLWDEWPDRWGPDCGIDLVARDRDGNNWAIQAKCYSPEYSITKKDLDTFISESDNEKIQCRLLIGTTDLIGKNPLGVIRRSHKVRPFHQFLLIF